MGIRRLSSNPVLLHGLLRVLLTLFHGELEVADRQACPGAVFVVLRLSFRSVQLRTIHTHTDLTTAQPHHHTHTHINRHTNTPTDTHTHKHTHTHVFLSQRRIFFL